MSREEAIKKMKAVKAYMTSGNPIWNTDEIAEAFDAAIEALEREPNNGKCEVSLCDNCDERGGNCWCKRIERSE